MAQFTKAASDGLGAGDQGDESQRDGSQRDGSQRDGSQRDGEIWARAAPSRAGVGEDGLGMAHHKGPGMVTKLPKAQVAELTSDGTGRPSSPACTALFELSKSSEFGEWVLVAGGDDARWQTLRQAAVAFVAAGG